MVQTATVHGIGVSMFEGGQEVPVVLLDANDQIVPIFISPDQAQSIRLALNGESFDRPLTQDLLVDMVTEFGAAIDSVRIDDLAGGTFYAKINAEQYRDGERRTRTFDARPSDGIAIALRVDCPIELEDTVVEEAGQPHSSYESSVE
ncbi:bifunctional nuclease family protein [Halocatena marina]|uniref:Bifunctional nuclease family protein n=1 Tax=Halocatena marina TaxID=2934937 RepID=A0ABD5YSD6_9EURY|nr:bifunctional nuclease family protein [Halocatena marina]